MGSGNQARTRPQRLPSRSAAAAPWLLDNGYTELPILSDHVVAIESLPAIHKDPFDRLLVAQATVEGITLLTVDSILAEYPGPVRLV